MSKQFIIRSGSVPSDSILPKFNDVFPSLVAPNKRKFTDLFDGAAGALNGRRVPVAPAAQTWSATAVVVLDGAGGTRTQTVSTGDARALIDAGSAGSQGEWGATFVAGSVGAFGLLLRQANSNQEGWRAVFRSNGQFSIQKTTTSGGVVPGAGIDVPFAYVPGVTYTVRAVVEGAGVTVYVNAVRLAVAAGVDLASNTRAGIYFRDSDAACLEFVGGS